MTPLKAGDVAPKFSLLDQDGEQVNLTDFQGQRVLVYFYPKAMTPGCTVQACGLRDNMDLSLIHISEPTRLSLVSRMPSSA